MTTASVFHLHSADDDTSLDTLIAKITQTLPFAGETLAAQLGGGIERLLWHMELAGYQLAEGIDFDCTYTLDGNQVLLMHLTRPSESGQWGLVWRSEWEFASILARDLGKLVRTLDCGITRLAASA